MERNHPKKCPRCNSSRVTIDGSKFHCKKCGFTNDTKFHIKNNDSQDN